MWASTLNHASIAQRFAVAAERYWLQVYPLACRELGHWQCRAAHIPDPALRSIALETQRAKRGNLEGAAAFATFAPSSQRASVIRASLTLQVIYDYADTLMEQPHRRSIANARQLHLALRLALRDPDTAHEDYYAHHSARADSHYLHELIDACRVALASLPSYGAVRESLQRNIERIIRYQALIDRPAEFAAWASNETPRDLDLRWWETGAACGSSMVAFALIAAAANHNLQASEAARIERTYFPWIGALHTLLDSLIDQPDDLASSQHSLIEHYDSVQTAAERMRRISLEAARRAQTLPASHGHDLMLAGMASQYLSSPGASLPHAQATRQAIIEAMAPLAAPMLAVFAARQRLDRFARARALVSAYINRLE